MPSETTPASAVVIDAVQSPSGQWQAREMAGPKFIVAPAEISRPPAETKASNPQPPSEIDWRALSSRTENFLMAFNTSAQETWNQIQNHSPENSREVPPQDTVAEALTRTNQILERGSKVLANDLNLETRFKNLQEPGANPADQQNYEHDIQLVETVAKTAKTSDQTDSNVATKMLGLTVVEAHFRNKLTQLETATGDNELALSLFKSEIVQIQLALKELNQILRQSETARILGYTEIISEIGHEKAVEAIRAIHQDDEARRIIAERQGKKFDRDEIVHDLDQVHGAIKSLSTRENLVQAENDGMRTPDFMLELVTGQKSDEALTDKDSLTRLHKQAEKLQHDLDYVDGNVRTNHLSNLLDEHFSTDREQILTSPPESLTAEEDVEPPLKLTRPPSSAPTAESGKEAIAPSQEKDKPVTAQEVRDLLEEYMGKKPKEEEVAEVLGKVKSEGLSWIEALLVVLLYGIGEIVTETLETAVPEFVGRQQ